jgi:hypothetical protein
VLGLSSRVAVDCPASEPAVKVQNVVTLYRT